MTTPPSSDRSGDRIAKLLARAGVASRREVERMIEEGRVKIGETVITTPNTVLENLKGVTVDGVPVKSAEATRLFVFHKPSGLITAERDPSGRPTIYTALRNALPPGTPRMMPVGRLDLNTEGLLLLTNDGELKRAMELPSSGIPRTYRARTYGDVTQAQLEELIEGVTIEGMHYDKIDANMERKTGRNQWIELTLTEGKNREIRRVLEHLGLEVSRLLRISYGPFELLDLPRGAAVEVRQVDLERFRKGLKDGGAAQAKINPHSAKAKPISTWVKPAPMPAPMPHAAPMREAQRADARTYRAGRPYGGQPRNEGWTPHSDDPAARAPDSRADARPGGRYNAERRSDRGTDKPFGKPSGKPGDKPFRSAAGEGGRRGAARVAGAPGDTSRPARPPRAESGQGRADTRGAAEGERPKSVRNLGGKPFGRPAGKSDSKDRGEKLLDRPKAPRDKPAEGKSRTGWAKAAPRKPNGGKPGPRRK